jgi:hypothetical protein
MTVLSLIFISSLPSITATDGDGDGLDDDWEYANGYNNQTKDNVIIVGEDEKVEKYEKEEWDRKEESDNLINTFLFVLLLSFGIFSLLAGIFTAYFGAGKSRAIGGVLLVLGLIVLLIWIYFGVLSSYPDDSLIGIVHWEAARRLEAFVTVLGAVIGAIVAIVLFLVAIM